MFGMHETPWLSFEESVNRYRVQGPFFAERQGLIPGPTDLGVSVKTTGTRMQIHAGVYNGEGYGRSELDKYKSIEGRFTARPFVDDDAGSSVSISGFYSYGWYANDRPRNVAIVMGTYEQPHVVATGQYLSATDNPFVARDVERSGMSFFGEVRQGLTGWAGVGRVDIFDPGRVKHQRLEAPVRLWRRPLESVGPRASGSRRDARAVVPDHQLGKAREPAARPDPRRVLGEPPRRRDYFSSAGVLVSGPMPVINRRAGSSLAPS
jgi:hypothetical protein